MTPAQQAIVDAFNMEVYDPNKMDVQNTPLYDTITVAAGSAVTNITTAFFNNVGPSASKTLASTNMSQPNRLAAPESFSIFGIRIRFSENIFRTDLISLMNGFAFRLFLGQKNYALGPIWYYSAGGGIFAVTTQTTESDYTNGLPTRESMHKLAIPIVIENQMNFGANLEGNSLTLTATASGGLGLTLQCLLDGFYARGVQ